MKKKKVICKWNRKPKNAPDANIAYQCIEEIKERRKGITPQLLIIESRKKKSPLHNCFEWNDSKAAKEYRIVQAHEILRSLVIEVDVEEYEEPRHVRALIAPSSIEADTTSWTTIGEVCDDEELQAAYMRQLKHDLNAIKNKIKSFKIFSEIVKAIEAVI